MNDKRQEIERMHQLYIELTGMEIRLDMAREGEWFQWLQRGFTEEDLRMVVAHLRRGIRDRSRQPGALKFRNMIGQVDYFEEDLAEARARMRQKLKAVDPERSAVLKATGRVLPDGHHGESEKAKSAADVMESQGFKDLMAFKETLRANRGAKDESREQK